MIWEIAAYWIGLSLISFIVGVAVLSVLAALEDQP